MVKVKKFLKHMVVLLSVILCLMFNCITTLAAQTLTVPVSVKYGQSDARSMLKMINDFRTGSDAWYWNSDNTQKVYQNLSALTYDYGLEQIAMQRAAEIAASFSHTRPNNSSCFTATVGSYGSYGENIAAGYTTATSAFTGWQETNVPYAGQGHRRNMLHSGFTCVGIAHVYVNGTHYWVQEFGYGKSGIGSTSANDGNTVVNMEISDSLINDIKVEAVKSLQLSVGDSVKAPHADVKVTLKDAWPSYASVNADIVSNWTVSGSAVSLRNGNIVAVSLGSSTLTADVYGKKVTVSVSVGCSDHKWGSWSTKRAATCTASGTQSRQCSVCKTEETKTIAAAGHKMGAYKVIKAATEKAEGLEERSCSVCGVKEQRTIAKLSSSGSFEASSSQITSNPGSVSSENSTSSTGDASSTGSTSSTGETTSGEAVSGGTAASSDVTGSTESGNTGSSETEIPIGGTPGQSSGNKGETVKPDNNSVPTDTDADSGNNTQLYIILISIVALAAAVVIIIIVLRKRKREE